MQQKERTYYGDTSTVLYAGDGSSYVPSATPEYVAQYESSTTGNYPYVDSSALRDNNITGGKWTNSQGGWTTYNGQSGRALAISSATPTTTTLTFEYDVASGYKMSAASFSFYQRASSTGYSQYTLSINGTQVGSGNLFVDVISQDNPLQWTGDQTLTTAMNNLTGHVTVVITLSGGTHGAQGTFRMDNFSLNGYTVPTSYSNAAPNLYIHKYNYRYGFNGKENDNEVKGEGDEQDYGMRIYDPRVGRFLSVDPLTQSYPWNSTYAFSENEPISNIDLDGQEKKQANSVTSNKKDQGTYLDFSSAKATATTTWKYIIKPSLNIDKKISEGAAALAVRQYAILKDPRVLNYSEAEKLEQFRSSADNSIAILLYEFATGTGNATQTFKANTEFAKKFADGYVTEEVEKSFYQIANKQNLTSQNIKDGDMLYQGLDNISFSPDNAGFVNSAEKHFSSNNVQFFVASTDYIEVENVNKEGVVTILVVNQTNKGSLLLHLDKLGVVQNEDRKISSTSEDKNKPLSTTYQFIELQFQLDPTKLKNRSDVKKIKPQDLKSSSNSDNTNAVKPVIQNN